MTEHVTNGIFDSDIVGWTDNSVGAASISWSANHSGTMYLQAATGADNARGDQQLAATVAGVQYKVTFDIDESNGSGSVEIGTSSGDDSLLNLPFSSTGAYESTFIATGATTWIGVEFRTDEQDAYIDNISVQEAYGGGYMQTAKGLARRTDPTLEWGDVAYRTLLTAKANANCVDATLANQYTYIVDAHEDITEVKLSDPTATELVTDGDMEASGVTAWSSETAGTVTKETTDPYEGTQNIKVAYLASSNPDIYQDILTPGYKYRLTCAVRSSGCSVRIRFGDPDGTVWWKSSSDWAYIDEIGTCFGSGYLMFKSSGCSTPGEYFEVDDVTIRRVFSAGDVELASNVGVVDIGINDDELLYQGERYRIQEHGPRTGGKVLNAVNWTFEYLPFTQYLNLVSSWTINDSTIDSYPAKILTCDTADFCWLPSHGHFIGQTDDDLAYGTWEWWIYKDAAGAPIVMPVASVAALPTNSSQDGYSVAISAAGALSLNEVSSGVATPLMTTAAATISDDTWTKITLTRSAANSFTVYIDDVSATAATGSNPVTDATTTTSTYMVLDLDASDQVGLVRFEGDVKLFTWEPI